LRDVEINRKNAIIQRFRQFAGDLRLYSERAEADFAVRLRDELWPVVEEYQGAKHRGGYLDFSDLLLAARDLMKNDDARHWFQNRYERVFVDEFQDTDPLQAEMLLLLASSDPTEKDWRKVVPARGKLFVVAIRSNRFIGSVALRFHSISALASSWLRPEPTSGT
jgi:ATP-dependent helicase/nuclease subunit A